MFYFVDSVSIHLVNDHTLIFELAASKVSKFYSANGYFMVTEKTVRNLSEMVEVTVYE